jgi:hypothetical protein
MCDIFVDLKPLLPIFICRFTGSVYVTTQINNHKQNPKLKYGFMVRRDFRNHKI